MKIRFSFSILARRNEENADLRRHFLHRVEYTTQK